MSSVAKISIVIAVLSVCQIALGQGGRRGFRGRDQGAGGDMSGGGFQWGGGGPGGGRFQKGGGDMGGGSGPMGGPNANSPSSGSDISQRMADSLKNLDTNGNGMIDPDEASDPRAKGMLDRIFRRIGKEPHYPVAISEILQDLQANSRGG